MMHVHDVCIMILISMMLVPFESVGNPGGGAGGVPERDRGGEEEEGLGQGYYEVWISIYICISICAYFSAAPCRLHSLVQTLVSFSATSQSHHDQQ